MLLNSHISAYARCLAVKVCGLVRSTWGTSLSGDKLGARDRILTAKVARWALGARRANIPPQIPSGMFSLKSALPHCFGRLPVSAAHRQAIAKAYPKEAALANLQVFDIKCAIRSLPASTASGTGPSAIQCGCTSVAHGGVTIESWGAGAKP